MSSKDGLTWAAIIVQIVAALLWLGSTIVKVSADKVLTDYQKIHGADSGPHQVANEDGSDFYATVECQSKWNRYAALATGLGIGLQAVVTAL
ncbi:hypothetical protein [Asticcacaulis taihuensis]|uniref:hypothetical protein n=1 Tax=Asticcacaulis taihuensis TaxID=260084 RepID=UPI003F7B7635